MHVAIASNVAKVFGMLIGWSEWCNFVWIAACCPSNEDIDKLEANGALQGSKECQVASDCPSRGELHASGGGWPVLECSLLFSGLVLQWLVCSSSAPTG